MSLRNTIRLLPICFSLAALAACGGGGGGGGNPPPPPVTYTIGGTLSGLATGASVVLQNNGGNNTTVSANGSFSFSTAVSSGGAYAVSVLTQPASPSQTCTVASGSGTATANVSNVTITCVTNNFNVGGTVSGLAGGTSVVLQNNGGSNLTVSANSTFTFATAVASGSAYTVTVLTQPAGQTCSVGSGTGTIAAAAVTNVTVMCSAITRTVGGTISGLATGATVVLLNNGGDSLSRTANGAFTFATRVAVGGMYAVTVGTQPTGQTCAVASGSGTIGGTDVTNVAVTCTTNTYAVGGTLSGLASGRAIVLRNNGGNDLTVNANGTFTFTTPVASGAAYAVTVATPPAGQSCAVTNGTGTIAAAPVTNVSVVCTLNTYTVGGAVSGLGAGKSVVLRNNGGNDLTVNANGTFTFSTAVVSGGAYAVTVLTQPTGQNCAVTNGAGTIVAADITNVAVTCTSNGYTIGGTISGLAATGSVVLRNNGGDNLTVAANGSFTFATPVLSGATYAVTVFTNPTVPAGSPAGQTCVVTSGSGTVAAANITTVVVTCSNNDTTAPTVTARSPAPTAVGSLLQGAVITVTFSEAVKTSSVTASSYSVEGPSGPITGTISFASGNTQAIFTPSAPTAALAFDSAYQVTLTTAIQDGAGNPLAANVVWTFNTGKKLAVGGYHECARMLDGRVKCWGGNNWGQLGIDTFGNHGDAPGEMGGDGVRGPGSQGLDGQPLLTVDLGAGRKAVSVAAGDTHTCVIMDNGQVKCWGRNEHGALGLGFVSPHVGRSPNDMANVVVPVNLGAGRTALEISLGDELSCARLDNGTVKCWGRNNIGQLGQGNTSDLGVAGGDIAAAPAIALGTGLTPLEIAAGGYHVCARLISATAVNSLKCWGDNTWGQLGQGDVDNLGDQAGEMGNALTAVDLGSSAYAVEVVTTSGHTCARLQTNAVKCWGNNGWGQIGLNAGNGSPANPAVCQTTTTALSRSCIGDQPGEMGDALPVVIGSGLAFSIGAGDRHSCARLVAGTVKCWGDNQSGQLALGSGKPVAAPPPDCVAAASCIGNANGEIAALANASLKPGKTIAELSVGGFVGCVLNTDSTIQCWGQNGFGQIGLGNVDNWGDEANELGNSLLWLDVDLGT